MMMMMMIMLQKPPNPHSHGHIHTASPEESNPEPSIHSHCPTRQPPVAELPRSSSPPSLSLFLSLSPPTPFLRRGPSCTLSNRITHTKTHTWHTTLPTYNHSRPFHSATPIMLPMNSHTSFLPLPLVSFVRSFLPSKTHTPSNKPFLQNLPSLLNLCELFGFPVNQRDFVVAGCENRNHLLLWAVTDAPRHRTDRSELPAASEPASWRRKGKRRKGKKARETHLRRRGGGREGWPARPGGRKEMRGGKKRRGGFRAKKSGQGKGGRRAYNRVRS